MSDRPSLVVRRPVAVLARVTPALKAELKEDVRRSLERLELELRQLNLQEKRLLGAGEDRERALQVSGEISRQRDTRRREIKDLLGRERHIEEMEPGSLIRRGSVEAEAHIEVGDRWDEMLGWEIILEDGIVVDIRRGETG